MLKLFNNIDLIDIFFNNPTKEFHIREISRMSKISPPAVSYKLENLYNLGLLNKKNTANLILFSGNFENPSFIFRKRIYNIEKLNSSGLINHIIDKYNSPEAVILFGTYSRGEDTEKSDIDIAIITEKNLHLDLEIYEKKLQRKIQIMELKQKKISDSLLNTLANGIILYGYLKVR